MRKTVRKKFRTWEFDEFEKWLNEMADDGFALVSAKLDTFEFEQTEKGEYKIAIIFLDSIKTANEQIEFIKQTGAEFVAMYGRWAFFRRKSELGEFALFSDNASKIKHISLILHSTIGLIVCFNYLILMNTFTSIISGPKSTTYNVMLIILLAFDILFSLLLIMIAIKLAKKRKKLKQQATLFE